MGGRRVALLRNEELKGFFGTLKQELCGDNVKSQDVNNRLAASCSKNEFLGVLKSLLLAAKKAKENTRLPQDSLRMAGSIKKLLSWVLLTAIDQRKLHLLIHQLNHDAHEARLELKYDVAISFQVIVSALMNSEILYRYTANAKEGEGVLQGKGELVLNERGASTINYYKLLEEERNWLTVKQYIHGEVSRTQYPGESVETPEDMDVLSGEIRELLEEDGGYYLLFEQTEFDISSAELFCQKMGEEFPEITQLMSSKDTGDTAQSYYLDGLNSGDLHGRIRRIYSIVERIKNDSQANP